MTKAELLKAGKEMWKNGEISEVALFNMQYAAGDFDGTVNTDTKQYNFTNYFQTQLDGEISRGGLGDPKSMVGIYQQLLSAMTNNLFEKVT